MKVNVQFNNFVQFNSVFEEEIKDISNYLKGISRSLLLEEMSFFLSISIRNSKLNDFASLLGTMFEKSEDKKIANQIYNKLLILEEEEQRSLTIISPLTSLQIFEYSFDNLTEQQTQSKAETRLNIFKAILAANQVNTTGELNAIETTDRLQKNEFHFAALILTQSYPYSELINYDLKEIMASQFIKSIYLFEFLESDKKIQPLLDAFLKYFNISDWKEFLKNYFVFIAAIINNEGTGHINFFVPEGENYSKNVEILEKLSVNDDEILRDYDFKSIRNKPFYKTGEGVYRVIFGLFALELIHKGLFFKLAELNGKLPKEFAIAKNFEDFRSFYCFHFSEKYLSYQILNKIYQNRYIEFNGNEINNRFKDFDGGPDYYIRKGNSLLLFESKDILVKGTIKTTYDFNEYERVFKEKLYFKQDLKGKIDNKAVLQLIQNIERVLRMDLPFDNTYKLGSIKIYPILLLHDHQFNVSGLNVVVNSWFQDELEKLRLKGLNVEKVRNLVIIDIDTFIINQDVFKSRKVKIEEIIDLYFKSIKFDYKRRYKDVNHSTKYLLKSTISFRDFLSGYLAEKKLLTLPLMLKNKGVKLFE